VCPAKTGKDKHSINKTTKSSLFMFSPLAKYAGFYQHLLRGTGNYEQLGNCLIQLGEQAHSLRQFDEVREIGLVLSNIPIRQYQGIGRYFLAVAANSMGNGDPDEARRLFEFAVDTAPDPYKLKSVLSLGALAFHNKDFDSAFYFYREVIRTGGLSSASLQATRGVTTLKSIEGYHKSAIADVERILPLIRFAPSNVYFDCLNSYAVELSEVGRLQEAESVSSLVVASPLIRYYPEWRETLSDVRSKRKHRFTVSISPPQEREYEPAALEPASKEIQVDVGEAVRKRLVREDRMRTRRVKVVIDFMNANFQRRLSSDELAEVARLSADYLSRLFKIETKLTLWEYLIRLRMEKARELLETSLLSIKEVMAAVGYDSKGHFARHFRRWFGVSPSEYRRNDPPS
jgi:AraC-like DNA-binding protein